MQLKNKYVHLFFKQVAILDVKGLHIIIFPYIKA